MSASPAYSAPAPPDGRGTELERPVDVKTAARFLGVSASLVYAYVERKQIPHFRMMGRAIRFRQGDADVFKLYGLGISNDFLSECPFSYPLRINSCGTHAKASRGFDHRRLRILIENHFQLESEFQRHRNIPVPCYA